LQAPITGTMFDGFNPRVVGVDPSAPYYGDDIVFALRPSTKPTQPRTPGLSLQLKPGDPLRSSWYPQLRPVPPWER
jgi:hypothetical protein